MGVAGAGTTAGRGFGRGGRGLDLLNRTGGNRSNGSLVGIGLFLFVPQSDLVSRDSSLALVDSHRVNENPRRAARHNIIFKGYVLGREKDAPALNHEFCVNIRGVLPLLFGYVGQHLLRGRKKALFGNVDIHSRHGNIQQNKVVANLNLVVGIREPLGQRLVLGADYFKEPCVGCLPVLNALNLELAPGALAGTEGQRHAFAQSRLLGNIEADLRDLDSESRGAVVANLEIQIAVAGVAEGFGLSSVHVGNGKRHADLEGVTGLDLDFSSVKVSANDMIRAFVGVVFTRLLYALDNVRHSTSLNLRQLKVHVNAGYVPGKPAVNLDGLIDFQGPGNGSGYALCEKTESGNARC